MRVRSISHAGPAPLVVLLAWGGVAVALLSQYRWGLEPCPWCIIQRIAYLVVGVFAILSLLAPGSRPGTRAPLLIAWIAALGGLVAALYQHFVAAQTSSCAFTAADKFLMATGLDELLPSIFKATAACDQANAPLLGIPYSLWSAMLALVLMVLIFQAWRRAGVHA